MKIRKAKKILKNNKRVIFIYCCDNRGCDEYIIDIDERRISRNKGIVVISKKQFLYVPFKEISIISTKKLI